MVNLNGTQPETADTDKGTLKVLIDSSPTRRSLSEIFIYTYHAVKVVGFHKPHHFHFYFVFRSQLWHPVEMSLSMHYGIV